MKFYSQFKPAMRKKLRGGKFESRRGEIHETFTLPEERIR